MEERVPAQSGRHEEHGEARHGDAEHPVVDVSPLETDGVSLLGLHTDTRSLEWTHLVKAHQ